jgi:hypothetical protein
MRVIGASDSTVVGIDSARGRVTRRPLSDMAPGLQAVVPTLRPETHDHITFIVPHAARLVKDIVWLAVISITLASIAVLVGFIDVFVQADLVPVVQGAGLASVAFGLAGLTDRLSGRK